MRVELHPRHGGVITALTPTGAGNLLWTRAGTAPHDLGATLAADSSVDDFDSRVFVGGWFAMFPLAGIPGALDHDLLMHGEAPRMAWDLVSSSDSAARCRFRTPRTGFVVDRHYEVRDSRLTITTRVINDSGIDQELTFGEHPCLDRAVFEGGAVELSARRAFVTSEASTPEATRYATGQEFDWPNARLRAGGVADASLIPVADGRHDHVCVELASAEVVASSPRLGGRLRLTTSDELSALLYWQHYLPQGSPWAGDTFGLELCSAPGRTLDDARRADSVTLLAAGAELEWSISAEWVAD